MMTKLHIYSGLKEFTKGKNVTEVHGNTVAECLTDLVRQFPQIQSQLFDENGKISDKIMVSINLKSAYPEELHSPVDEGDELYLVRVIAGG